MKRLLFLILCIWATGLINAQDSTKAGRRKFTRDTINPLSQIGPVNPVSQMSPIRSEKPEKREHRKFDSSLFSEKEPPTRSDYLEDLEKVFQLLNQVPAVTESFAKLDDIHEQLDQEDSALAILKERIALSDRTLNIRNLQMFNTLLDELHKNLTGYSKRLNDYDSTLDNIKKGIAGLNKDTLMRKIFRDSALKTSFLPQLEQLRGKWRLVDSLVRVNTTEIDNLKARVSFNAIAIEELLNRVDSDLKTVGTRAFGKERRYLWEPLIHRNNYSRESFRKSLEGEQQLARYYFANNRSKRLWLLLTGLLFFYWVWYNFRSLKRLDKMNLLSDFHFKFISPTPVVASMVFLLSLAPLFDLHAPSIYIESTQFLQMLLLTIIFRKRLPPRLFYGWCIFILLFLLMPVTRILGLPVSMLRWANLIQNSLSVAFGLFFLFSAAKTPEKPKVVSFAAGLYVFLNLLAIVCNVAGRVTLSQIFGTTAAYAFAQTVSLAVFVQMLVEAFLLQVQTSRLRKKYPEHFEYASVARSVDRFGVALAVILWLIVFTTNLNLLDALSDLLVDIFSEPHRVGSIQFTLRGILLFMGIIWIAHFLQKYIAYFFGDIGDDAAIDDKGQRSRLLVTRLILLIAGFLVAVAASGLPIDKITVILGALGVGIGLGLQSIVNNFVSGIILIFDRPLRIGDTVEIGDKRGRVKAIGIRSSTLLTEEGAEVIIPNGDVLSHNIVNWTLSNNHIRIALSFMIDRPGHPEDIGSEDIAEIIKSNPNVLERREPEIIMNNISSKTIEIKVFFWGKDITKTALTSGEIRMAIYHHLEKKGINIL